MEQMSNKTLVFLLIAVIVVSVGGTIISLNKINRLTQLQAITGMASEGTGYVNVSVISLASIQLVDTRIDFGACTPNISTSAKPGANLSSNDSSGSWGDDAGICTRSGTDNITIKNDGNAFINVTVQTNTLAANLIAGDEPFPPGFYFSSRNATVKTGSYGPGCHNNTNVLGATGLQWIWKNFSDATTNFGICDNLTYTSDKNAIFFFVKIEIPTNAPAQGEQEADITFTANEH